MLLSQMHFMKDFKKMLCYICSSFKILLSDSYKKYSLGTFSRIKTIKYYFSLKEIKKKMKRNVFQIIHGKYRTKNRRIFQGMF